MARQGRFLSRRQLAWPVAAPRAGADFPGASTPDQRLVDVRHADPEHRGRRPRRHAAVNRHQNPRPQVLRIALTLPPSHRRPQHLVVWAANHTFPRAGIPFGDSGQCGYALATQRPPERTDRVRYAGERLFLALYLLGEFELDR